MRFKNVFLAAVVALSAGCSVDPTGISPHASTSAFAYSGDASSILNSWFQGFETDITDWQPPTSRVASGTNGVTSATGAFHAEVGAGAFSQFGAYENTFPGDYVAELDVYLDPAWAVGQGFDWSVAANKPDGTHRRDFIFHFGVVPDGRLLVNANNNSDFVNPFILMSGSPYHITTAGWYTMQHIFYNDGGVLAVDMNLLNSAGTVLFTTTRKEATDIIGVTVGGHRYGWIVLSTRTLAVDNHRLGTIVPKPGNKDDCKNGGWAAFGFRNQGLCIASFNHG